MGMNRKEREEAINEFDESKHRNHYLNFKVLLIAI